MLKDWLGSQFVSWQKLFTWTYFEKIDNNFSRLVIFIVDYFLIRFAQICWGNLVFFSFIAQSNKLI